MPSCAPRPGGRRLDGQVFGIVILATALMAGAALYYLQVYHFYEEVTLASEGGEVEMKITLADGSVIDLPAPGFRGDRRRQLAHPVPRLFRRGAAAGCGPRPLRGRRAAQRAGLVRVLRRAGHRRGARGGARARLSGRADIEYGIDRVIAVTEDGRAYAWHQINRCGEVVFDGQPAPDDCPDPPQGY